MSQPVSKVLLASLVSFGVVEEPVLDSSTEPPESPPDDAAVLPEDEEPVVELPVAELSTLLVPLFEPEDRFPDWTCIPEVDAESDVGLISNVFVSTSAATTIPIATVRMVAILIAFEPPPLRLRRY
jgi:hypothetical protein